MELVVGKKTYKWYGRWVNDYNNADAAYKQGLNTDEYGKCEHVIKAKGQQGGYEIGLVKNPNGAGLVPVLDFYGPGAALRDLVGDKGQHLGTAYNKAAIKQQAKLEGYTLTEQKLENGKIRLVATSYNI